MFLFLTGLSGALAVAFGAFGAHALRDRLPADLFAVYQTGSLYHLIHTLALFGAALLLQQSGPSPWARAAAWLFVAGMLIFSGSLYALAISGTRWLGAITPVGGVALIGAWLCLAMAALERGA